MLIGIAPDRLAEWDGACCIVWGPHALTECAVGGLKGNWQAG